MSGGLPLVGLHGAPRSGTSWIGQIFNSAPEVAYRYQPFFAHAFRPRVDAAETPADLERILDEVAGTEDDFVLQRGAARVARAELAFAKTAPRWMVYKEVRYHHLLPQLMRIERFKGVGIVRDPVAVLDSWARAPREFDPAWDLQAEWRSAPRKNAGRVEEFYGYEGWKRAALTFRALAAEHPDRFRLLRYERLTADPMGETKALFDFLGLELSPPVRDFLTRSTSRHDGDPYGVFRDGRTAPDAPPSAVTPAIREAIRRDLHESGLDDYAA